MCVGAEGGAGGGEGEGRWTLEVQVPRAAACQLQTLAPGWHQQPVPTPFCLGDGAHEARVAGSQARSMQISGPAGRWGQPHWWARGHLRSTL